MILVQMWQGIPKIGGAGWQTFSERKSSQDADRLLMLIRRIRPEYCYRVSQ